jgi:hypothetical protein
MILVLAAVERNIRIATGKTPEKFQIVNFKLQIFKSLR